MPLEGNTGNMPVSPAPPPAPPLLHPMLVHHSTSTLPAYCIMTFVHFHHSTSISTYTSTSLSSFHQTPTLTHKPSCSSASAFHLNLHLKLHPLFPPFHLPFPLKRSPHNAVLDLFLRPLFSTQSYAASPPDLHPSSASPLHTLSRHSTLSSYSHFLSTFILPTSLHSLPIQFNLTLHLLFLSLHHVRSSWIHAPYPLHLYHRPHLTQTHPILPRPSALHFPPHTRIRTGRVRERRRCSVCSASTQCCRSSYPRRPPGEFLCVPRVHRRAFVGQKRVCTRHSAGVNTLPRPCWRGAGRRWRPPGRQASLTPASVMTFCRYRRGEARRDATHSHTSPESQVSLSLSPAPSRSACRGQLQRRPRRDGFIKLQ